MSDDKRPKDELAMRVLTILKLDSSGLKDRLVNYFPEYVNILTSKRTREHFKDLFRSKYETITFEDLRRCSQEIILEVERFYARVLSMKWYLYHTEDMPNRIQDKIAYDLKDLERSYDMLALYIDAELAAHKDDPRAESA